jgi:type IV secretory pathway TrbL component
MKDKPSSKKVTIAKGVKVKRGVEEKIRSKKGSGSAGKYKSVAPKEFAGKAGGASKVSYPINTLARARNALARAHYAPHPEGIRAKVYKKYPQLKLNYEKRHGGKSKHKEKHG